jgi:enoyl-CoA hydratase
MTDERREDTVLEQGGIRLVRIEGVALLTIERETRRNSLDNPALEGLIAALDIIPSLRVAVSIIASQGTKAFCAGSDLKALLSYSLDEKVRHTRLFLRAMAAIDEAPCATIAAIEGFCLGGGLEIVLACDRRVASAESIFGFPEIGVGALPTGGGTLRAPRALGLARARDMLVFGDRIDARTAADWGLIGHVCPAGEARATALAMAAEYAARVNPRSVSLLKQLMHNGFSSPERATHTIAALSDEILLATEESTQKMKEGVRKVSN